MHHTVKHTGNWEALSTDLHQEHILSHNPDIVITKHM